MQWFGTVYIRPPQIATSDKCLCKYSIIRFVKKKSFIGKFKSYELRRKPQLDIQEYSVFFQDSESDKSVQVFSHSDAVGLILFVIIHFFCKLIYPFSLVLSIENCPCKISKKSRSNVISLCSTFQKNSEPEKWKMNRLARVENQEVKTGRLARLRIKEQLAPQVNSELAPLLLCHLLLSAHPIQCCATRI